MKKRQTNLNEPQYVQEHQELLSEIHKKNMSNVKRLFFKKDFNTAQLCLTNALIMKVKELENNVFLSKSSKLSYHVL
jgi:hypothetical protein